MRNQSNLAENTIIIEPGSFYLRIGRAVETNPKRFPHCISRKPKSKRNPPIREQIIPRSKLDLSEKFEQALDQTKNVATELFSLPSSNMICKPQLPKLQTVQSGDLESAKLFEWESDLSEDQDYFVLNEAFEFGLKLGHHISWPIRYGFFNPTTNYTSILQDLQDIWTVALEKHVGIPRSNFSSYRVILIIEDVYKRNEIRHLTDLLLNRLRFGRVFLHQSSVCATYGVGLPTACVINIGDQKTSVCCVEDGVAHTDARVTLSVGRSDVLRAFHSFILPKGFDDGHDDDDDDRDRGDHKLKDFAYNHLSDISDLRSCLDLAEQSAIEFICRQIVKPDDNPDNPTPNNETESMSDQIFVPLIWNYACKQCPSLAIPISTIPIANLLPFSALQFTYETSQSDIYSNYRCMFQLPPNQSSEPDDPFDDLYIALTARERRKRGTNQVASQNDPNSTDVGPGQETERNETDPAELSVPLTSQTNPVQSNPKEFANLPDAVWWSINQCSNLIASQMSIPDTNPSNPNQTSQSTVSTTASDEMRRRLLGCILLCGGGISSVGSQFLERWLTRQLNQLIQDKLTGSTLPSPAVEIIKQTDRADLCWSGARLLLTTDLINDLWITPTEWRRFGSRAIREKAPFLW